MSELLTEEQIEKLPIGDWFQTNKEPDIKLVDFLMYKNGKIHGRMPEFEFREHKTYLAELPETDTIEIEETSIHLEPPVDLKELFQKDTKQGSYDIANYLVDKFHVKTIAGKRDRDIYIYENGIYRLGENDLRQETQLILEEFGITHVKNEVIEKVKDLTIVNRRVFDISTHLINLNNGTYNIETGELTKHDPGNLFLHKIPVDFKAGADCPIIKKFLGEVLNESDISVIQEWLGFCLFRSYFIKKAMILVGERDTGKTTLLNLIASFIGKENMSGVSLQKIVSDRFAVAYLYNKQVNIYDDLSFKDINDNGAFKIATGGGIISGEYKFGDQFQFENYSKLIFACNKIPDVKDANDEAYFSRWIVIPFNRITTTRDELLGKKLKCPEELSGMLNFAIEGLNRVLKQHGFTYNKDPEEIKVEMMRSGSGIANFAYDCLENETGSWISKEKLYEAYANYAYSENLPVESISKFGSKIKSCTSYLIDSKHRDQISGKLTTGWRNVKLKTTSEETLPSEELIRDIMDT